MKHTFRNNSNLLNPLFQNFFELADLPEVNFSVGKNAHLPATNVTETKDAYLIKMATPGFTKEDLKIELEKEILKVSASVEEKTESNEEKITRQEFTKKSFSRSFTMPENVEENNIKASYENGILNLELTKLVKKEKEAKTIVIN
ncbi:MAG: Hsp20/alpha crystallin family protein [Chitinophagaceae bacterium]|nr:Hsp20/alpha crystallin family protein [Chitinophagaceae bacterium]